MPELPEIYHLRDQLNDAIQNCVIQEALIFQPKSVNLDLELFNQKLYNKTIQYVRSKGKWLFIHLNDDSEIGINLGMGGEISLVDKPLEIKHQVEIHFKNNQLLNIRFWWFGYVHYIEHSKKHQITDSLGVDYLSDACTFAYFKEQLHGRRGLLKNFLLNQHHISGIGNYYIHDIMYYAKLHPLRTIPSLTDSDIERLFNAIKHELNDAYQQNGSYYEEDIYQQKGRFKADQVAYKEGEQCPSCHSEIKKIKTGQTTSYFCPNCQV
jgi:formamidopyrimidine-DNA glycosylase